MDMILKRFGYTDFREGQKEVIDALMNGKDAIAILPTGNGKSFIYQYIGLKEECKVLVVSPLIALMVDQVAALKEMGIHQAVALTSLMSEAEKSFVLRTLHEYQFIFVSPEMLQTQKFIQSLKTMEIGLLVVDEAHCISQWGYDFRSDYLFIGQIRKYLKKPRTLALTATATQQVVFDIYNFLGLEKEITFFYQGNAFLKNRAIDLIPVEGKRSTMLAEICKRVEFPCIVYAPTIKEVEGLKEYFLAEGFTRIESFHSKRKSVDRQTIQQQFFRGEIRILIATSAFGMGINQSNIRTIIHYRLPQTLEDYVQQIGRAGRDLKFCRCISLVHLNDFEEMRSRISYTYDSNIKNETTKNIEEIAKAFCWNPIQKEEFLKRQCNRKIEKVERVKAYAMTLACKEVFLAEYFGDATRKPCGQCSSCQKKNLFELPIQKEWDEKFASRNSFEATFKKLFNLQ